MQIFQEKFSSSVQKRVSDTKKRFIKNVVSSTCTCGPEIWSLKKFEESYLEDFELYYWTRALRSSGNERVPTDEVLKRLCEIRTLTGTGVERRSSMVSHLLHHSNWFTTLAGEGPGRST